jgi:hypothetical protein
VSPPGREGGLGRLVAASLALAAFAPVGLSLVPLAMLLAASRPRRGRELAATAAVTAVAVIWLLGSGDPPDQLARAAAVLSGAAFALATWYWRSSVTHRALFAIAVTALALGLLFPLLGWSWDSVRWWVAHRAGFGVRLALGQLAAREPSAGSGTVVPELERWLETGVGVLADHFAAVLAVQVLAGLGLTAAIYYRLSPRPAGEPPGAFRDFRFSEHLGWVAAVALAIVLVPRLAAAKLAAANVLLVAALLYALRGVAVAAFGVALMGGGAGWGTAALFGLLALFILPAAVAGAIVLGLLDAGLDLRRRWAAPPSRE